jgi:hypothetical protein
MADNPKFRANDLNFGADEETGYVWLLDTKANAIWYEALAAIDWRGDKKPLIELLQSGQPVPPSIAFYLGDLLDRYVLKLPKARPRKPGYLRTWKQIKLIAGVIEVHRLVHLDEVPLADAMKRIAAEAKLPEETLRSAYLGQHGGLWRARRHWYRP